MSVHSYRNLSRTDWGAKVNAAGWSPTHEDLKLGALLRIADALEVLAGTNQPGLGIEHLIEVERARANGRAWNSWKDLAGSLGMSLHRQLLAELPAYAARADHNFCNIMKSLAGKVAYDVFPGNGDARLRPPGTHEYEAVREALRRVDLCEVRWEELNHCGPARAAVLASVFAKPEPQEGTHDAAGDR